jgi:putative ABC transport system permease protein
MSIFSLVIKNIAQRKLSIALTALSVALGVALISATLDIKKQVEENFTQTGVGYELILGAKGSPLQLVLNTVYHLGNPTGNLPYSTYQQYKRNPFVSYAIPMGLGDNYKGFRIIGTTDELFSKFNYKPERKLELESGAFFQSDSVYQAVIGFEAAMKTGLKVGDKFIATHGLQESFGDVGEQHEHDPMRVVGVLKRTGTPSDKAIYISLRSVWAIHAIEEEEKQDRDSTKKTTHSDGTPHTDGDKHHDHDAHSGHDEHGHDEHGHDEHEHAVPTEGDVTAILVKTKAPIFALQLYSAVNKAPLAQAAFVVNEIKNLFDIVGNVNWAFLLVTALVIVVALISVGVAIYNSLSERRREIAIMRSLGAHRGKIFSMITLEAAFISFVGALVGIGLSKVLMAVMKSIILEKTGVEVAVSAFSSVDGLLILGVGIVGALVGTLPAITAYRTDVAKNLSPLS